MAERESRFVAWTTLRECAPDGRFCDDWPPSNATAIICPMADDSLPTHLRFIRWLADWYGWLPLILLTAVGVSAVVSLATDWLNFRWVHVLLAVVGGVGLTSLLFTTWEEDRVELYEYEHREHQRKP